MSQLSSSSNRISYFQITLTFIQAIVLAAITLYGIHVTQIGENYRLDRIIGSTITAKFEQTNAFNNQFPNISTQTPTFTKLPTITPEPMQTPGIRNPVETIYY